jgi:uncharacterized protein (DUF58 family)
MIISARDLQQITKDYSRTARAALERDALKRIVIVWNSPALERDEIRFDRRRALALCLSMIFSENRYTLFRIMLWSETMLKPRLSHRLVPADLFAMITLCTALSPARSK